jgi:formate-dependent phosphoribosylglycinamide formyltransferase (GAR transformylase)
MWGVLGGLGLLGVVLCISGYETLFLNISDCI